MRFAECGKEKGVIGVFCEVYLLDAPYGIDRPFDYSCGEGVTRGDFVKVPFGFKNGLRIAVVVGIKDFAEDTENAVMAKIKPVHSVLDRQRLSEEMLGLCLFMKEHTLCTFGEAVRCILPPGYFTETLSVKFKRVYKLAITKDEARELLTKSGMKVYNHRIIGGFDVVNGRVNEAIHGDTTVAAAIGSAASAWEIVVDSYNMRYGLGEYAE